MRRLIGWTVVSLAVMVAPGRSQDPAAAPHVMLTPAELTWGPGPPGLPPGSTLALVAGDPGKPGPFTVRAKMPAGYKVPPHWHPVYENITVLSGTVAFGSGD